MSFTVICFGVGCYWKYIYLKLIFPMHSYAVNKLTFGVKKQSKTFQWASHKHHNTIQLFQKCKTSFFKSVNVNSVYCILSGKS